MKQNLVSKKSTDKPIIAVITGDIVQSSSIPNALYEDLLYTLHSQLTYICTQHDNNSHQVMRGDSFQIIIHDVKQAFRYALLLRTALKAQNSLFDCRLSIGIGHHDPIRYKVGYSTGEAFTLSGRAFDKMKPQTLILSSMNTQFNEQFSLLTQYLDQQVSNLSQRQSAISHLKIKEPHIKQQTIADELDANRVSISRSSKRARLDLIESYLNVFAHNVETLLL